MLTLRLRVLEDRRLWHLHFLQLSGTELNRNDSRSFRPLRRVLPSVNCAWANHQQQHFKHSAPAVKGAARARLRVRRLSSPATSPIMDGEVL
jgi:hypothetical protein